MSSATRKRSTQLKEQWLRQLHDHRLLAANLIVFKYWLESTLFIQEDLLAQQNLNFKTARNQKTSTFSSNADDSTKPRNSEESFKDGQHVIWSCDKFKSMKLKEWLEHVHRFKLF